MMRMKSIVAGVVLAFALAAGAAFGTGFITKTDAAKAGRTSQVVKQLRKLNHKLRTTNHKLSKNRIELKNIKIVVGSADSHLSRIDDHLGTRPSDANSVLGEIHKVKRNTYAVCRDSTSKSVCEG